MPEEWLTAGLAARMEEWARKQATALLLAQTPLLTLRQTLAVPPAPLPSSSAQEHNSLALVSNRSGSPAVSESSSPSRGASPSSTTHSGVPPPPPALPSAECVVCGDKASGKHYGQFSCEGCKSFFKRSIRRSLSYSCRGSKSCPVDIHHRNQCQFCRLRKCVKMGMRKEGARSNAQRSGGRVGGVPGVPPPPFFFLPDRLHPPSLLPPSIAHLLAAEPIHRFAFSGLQDSSAHEMSSQLLLALVEWTRRLAVFLQLKLADQELLLRKTWPALFCMQAALTGLPMPTQKEDEADEGSHAESLADSAGSSPSHLNAKAKLFQTLVERVRSLQLDAAEGASLKALLFFSPDISGLSDSSRVEEIQEKVQAALEDYFRNRRGSGQQAVSGRFGRLVLRVSSLRCLDASLVSSLFFSHLLSSGATMDSLLHDLQRLNPPSSQLFPSQSSPFPFPSPFSWSSIPFPPQVLPSLFAQAFPVQTPTS